MRHVFFCYLFFLVSQCKEVLYFHFNSFFFYFMGTFYVVIKRSFRFVVFFSCVYLELIFFVSILKCSSFCMLIANCLAMLSLFLVTFLQILLGTSFYFLQVIIIFFFPFYPFLISFSLLTT